MKSVKLYIGVKVPESKTIEVYRSIRLDVFHTSQRVKDQVEKCIDEIFNEYADEDTYDTEGE